MSSDDDFEVYPEDVDWPGTAANLQLEVNRLTAELPRARRIEKAATALVEWERGGGTRDGVWTTRKTELFDALVREVRGNG